MPITIDKNKVLDWIEREAREAFETTGNAWLGLDRAIQLSIAISLKAIAETLDQATASKAHR